MRPLLRAPGLLLMVLMTTMAAAGLAASSTAQAGYSEAPELAAQVQAGSLPPLTERLPESPFVDSLDQPWQSVGRYGDLRGGPLVGFYIEGSQPYIFETKSLEKSSLLYWRSIFSIHWVIDRNV